ncbi:MAG: PAS domain-containing protein, partial [Proteobacteria bacterium]|nr:PAS domain-containing protein [Pseudomonadota bacterium]
MPGALEALLTPVFGLSAVLYLGLAVYVSRSSPQSIIGFFLFLIGVMIGGTAFTYGTTDAGLYGIGRVLNFFSGGFLPVAFYVIYRQYAVGPPKRIVIAFMSLIPIATTILALSNSMHSMIWAIVETESGLRFSLSTDHFWFNRVHAPFAYGLLGYSLIAMVSRLPSIALAHQRTVVILLICAALPFAVSIANTFLGFGPPAFPFLSSTLVLLLPVYVYASLSLRVYEFSPLAYQTLFDHVRDSIIVLDNNQRIICANKQAEAMLGKTEREMLGQKLWDDFPEARAILDQARDLDLTKTLRLQADKIYETSIAPLTDANGRKQGVVIVCRDITERRQARSQLADSEHLIRTLIETSSNGILRFSRDQNDERHRYR